MYKLASTLQRIVLMIGKIIAHPNFQGNSTTIKLPKLLDQVLEKLHVTKVGSVLTLLHFLSVFLRLPHCATYRHVVYPEMLIYKGVQWLETL